jgi:tetratricopeptide (TPR) repeat protein
MDFPSVDLRSSRKRLRQLWKSEAAESLRFYAGYFRWPLLLILLGLGGEKLIYYGLLPLDGYITREIAYAEAAHEDAIGDDRAATLSIRRALLQTRDNARLWRLAARISDHAHSPEGAYCWQQADRLCPGSADTELSLAEAALANQQLDLAASALGEVAPAERETVRFQIDSGRNALADGQSEQARVCFERVEMTDPHEAKTLFALADWHTGLADPRDLARAHDLLAGLTREASERPAAWRALIRLDLKRGDISEARLTSETLLASPDAIFADRIQRLDIASRESPGAVEDRLASLLRTQDCGEMAAVLTWMTAHGRAEEALLWIRHQTEEVQDDPAIGTARAGCLTALGDWEHLRDDQRDSSWPGHEPERLTILAQACLVLKEESDARSAWNQAIEACRDTDDFVALLRATDRLAAPDGWGDEKAAVWMALARQYPDQQWPLRALLAYQLGRGDLLQVLALYTRLAAIAPDDLSLAANRDLVCLLRGTGMEKASADLQRLDERAPGNPTVATAAAYALHLQGKDNEALGAMGALTAEELQAPERAAYLGQLLAAAGPVDRAEACLNVARARPQLLAEERAGVDGAMDLVAYRRAMADLLHAPIGAARDRSIAFFSWRAASGTPLFVMGQSVALRNGGDGLEAMGTLARVDPAALDPAALTIYEGAVLDLAGGRDSARYLELAGDLPSETNGVKLHRALDGWWALRHLRPADSAAANGLFATYHALESVETGPAFWRGDWGHEVQLTRDCLRRGEAAAAVQDRLESLVRHVPSTPQIEAQIGYALFLQGRVQAARARLEILSPDELAQPEAALYYGTILQACGETGLAEDYLRRGAGYQVTGAQIAQQRPHP